MSACSTALSQSPCASGSIYVLQNGSIKRKSLKLFISSKRFNIFPNVFCSSSNLSTFTRDLAELDFPFKFELLSDLRLLVKRLIVKGRNLVLASTIQPYKSLIQAMIHVLEKFVCLSHSGGAKNM